MPQEPNWTFVDHDGTFTLDSPGNTSFLYFPLVNEAGLKSCLTPNMHGDVKSGQHSFLTRPLSVEDLHESRATRNFWIDIAGNLPWSASGSSANLTSSRYQPDQVEPPRLEAGLLWHRITRHHPGSSLEAEITSLIPPGDDQVELNQITLKNTGDNPLRFSLLFAVPIFGRSADNLRDHRHVTSLLNQIDIIPHGVIVQPTLVFDESGHHPNETCYAVIGADQNGAPPAQLYPEVKSFIGEGGSLDWPEAVIKHQESRFQSGQRIMGVEALGGMRFPEINLEAGNKVSYVIILGIADLPGQVGKWIKNYGTSSQFDHWLGKTREFWKGKLDPIQTKTRDKRRDGWTRWVAVQPILRQLFGNSFLPYHDYGRGGRGWRDLWQDILGLLLMRTDDVSQLLESNFAGVRFDGSNATIIGHQPGEFTADRNNIPRVWMDHGAWPLFTTKMYLDWTGDLDFLRQTQPYFRDHLTHRSELVDRSWTNAGGTVLKTSGGDTYQGSIFEHLLIQNLVPFYNVGSHNCIRLEGADWNDALDMARQQGESVAFTSFYAGNLGILADLAEQLAKNGDRQIAIARELEILLDSESNPVDYDDPLSKRERLSVYLDTCADQISGQQIMIDLEKLAADLRKKGSWMIAHLQKQEWIEEGDHGWFNGYYDDEEKRVEGVFNDTVQMTLTGQVFPLMFGIATDQQAQKISDSVQRYLYDPAVNGVRLNTEFKSRTDALGRMFGFAYGHKENGAMFTHMAVMYAYALFERGLSRQAMDLLEDLYQHCQNFPVSRMYPGLPEYLDPEGRCMYPYLTGSASWYMLTLITQIFGLRGILGDLHINPELDQSWFDEQAQTSAHFPFAGRSLQIVFHLLSDQQPGRLTPIRVEWNGQQLPASPLEGGLLIMRNEILAIPAGKTQQLDVYLTASDPAEHNGSDE